MESNKGFFRCSNEELLKLVSEFEAEEDMKLSTLQNMSWF